MSMRIKPEEVVSRKEYLKKKNRERKIKRLKGISASTKILICFIIITSIYVVYQFSEYNEKHRLVQTLPDEISSLKDFYIYYVSDGYTYEKQNSLKYMSAMSDEKTSLAEGKGISKILVSGEFVYGLKDGGLIRINRDGRLTKLIQKNVQSFTIQGDDIYALLKGEGVETGIYTLNKRKKQVKLIDGEFGQLIATEKYIYAVNSDRQIVRYDKDGKNIKTLTVDVQVSYMILHDSKIYFVNKSDDNRIYRLNLKDDSILKITKDSSGVCDNGAFEYVNGEQYLGASKEYIYYMNSKDSNKLYKAKVDGTEETILLKNNIQILDIIDDTIFYKVQGDIGIYRFDATSKVSSQVTSARVLEFKVSEK